MQTLRIEDTDPRLEFGLGAGVWTVQGDYHYSEAVNARFYILFRGQYQTLLRFPSLNQPWIQGTGIKIYGQEGNDGCMIWFTPDGNNPAYISVNGTSNGTKLIWNISGLPDGDHQVHGLSLPQNGGNKIWIDYVEYVCGILEADR